MGVPEIFLSYNREDQARAKLFAEAFEAQGFKVWWDVGLRTGEAYDEVTETALRTAKAVVVLWSKKSVQSRWVRAEATLADRNKTLVPCMIEPCERPIMFELTQTAELGHWQGDASDRAWVAFLGDVGRFVGREAPVAQQPVAITAPPPAPKGERGEKPSLAIMPFANRSGVAEDDALAFGMVEDIISAISLSPDMRVLASSSTQQWAGKPVDLRVVGRDLGVRYVLEGSTRRAGANLRVAVQLVEAETGAILWTQKFDRPLSQLAELQEDLVVEVAGHLGVAVQNLELDRALKKPGDISAYEATQRAWIMIGRQRPGEIELGITEARRALAIAPDYAAAHALLALGQSIHFFASGDASLKPEVLRNIERALPFAQDDPFALSVFSVALARFGRAREALRQTQRAVQLNPNLGVAYGAMGFAQVMLGLNDESIASLDRNRRLAPGDFGSAPAAIYRATAHLQAGRMDEAFEAIEQGFAINQAFVGVLLMRTGIASLAGRAEDARDSMRRLRQGMPGATVETCLLQLAARMDPASPAVPAFEAAFRKVWDETPN